MSKIKHLGKFTDDGDYIELPFVFDEGKYRVEIKPSGETKRDKTIYVDEDGVMKLPNFNGRKAFALGSNIFLIYRIVNSQRERIWKDGYSRFSLFLKAKAISSDSQIKIQKHFFDSTLETKITFDEGKYILYNVFGISGGKIETKNIFLKTDSLKLEFDFPTSGFVNYLII